MAKKIISITLYVSELTYGVQNNTYLTGRTHLNGNNFEHVANMQANDDIENANQISRSIGNAFATLKMELNEYLEENDVTANNILPDTSINLNDAPKTLTLSLMMPTNFNNAVKDTISTAAHQYIVNTAISDWFTITNKEEAQDYLKQAAMNLVQIKKAINKRIRPKRTTI